MLDLHFTPACVLLLVCSLHLHTVCILPLVRSLQSAVRSPQSRFTLTEKQGDIYRLQGKSRTTVINLFLMKHYREKRFDDSKRLEASTRLATRVGKLR